jgi:hypothetical protein
LQTNKKLCGLLFRDSLKDFQLQGLIGLVISLLWPLGMLLKLGTGEDFWNSFAVGEFMIAFIFVIVGFFRLLAAINRVWVSSRFRLLPVSTKQLYFSNLLMKTAGFLVIIGGLAIIDLLLSGVILKFVIMTPHEFQLAISKADFSAVTITKFVIGFLDMAISLVVELVFLLIVTETLENFVAEKYQRLAGVGGFIVLLGLFTFVNDKISNLITKDVVSVTSLLFDVFVMVLCIWASLYLLKNQIESRK